MDKPVVLLAESLRLGKIKYEDQLASGEMFYPTELEHILALPDNGEYVKFREYMLHPFGEKFEKLLKSKGYKEIETTRWGIGQRYIIRECARRARIKMETSERMLFALIESIIFAISHGHKVYIWDWGTFYLKKNKKYNTVVFKARPTYLRELEDLEYQYEKEKEQYS